MGVIFSWLQMPGGRNRPRRVVGSCPGLNSGMGLRNLVAPVYVEAGPKERVERGTGLRNTGCDYIQC